MVAGMEVDLVVDLVVDLGVRRWGPGVRVGGLLVIV